MFRLELKQILGTPVFILSCLSLYLLMIMTRGSELLGQFLYDNPYFSMVVSESGIILYFEMVMGFSITGLSSAIFVVLPLIWRMASRWESGTYYTIIRSGRKRYFWGKISSAVISGMLVMAIACILFCVSLALIGFPIGISLRSGSEYEFDKPLMHYFEVRGWRWAILCAYIFSRMLFAGVCCLITLTVSAFTSNRYILVGLPFLMSMGVSLIAQVNGLMDWIDLNWINFDYQLGMSNFLSSMRIVVLYTVICCSLYCGQTRRRLKHG